ncbi:MAG: purine-binding chemotaxis protein CheW [Tissierella sp.]|nr:purine-binding chemotaxis protein CheW [Tissierella sp.]
MKQEQYIVFINNDQKFALYVSKVDKIIEFQQPKKLPDTSEYFIGVIQYNNKILPIIDLSKRLYNKNFTQTIETKIIVVMWKERLVGLVVDDIIGIRDFIPTQLEDFEIDVEISNEYIIGFIKSHGDIIVTLDIDKIFTGAQENELNLISDDK